MVISIGYNLKTIDICNTMGYNCYAIGQITRRVDVNNVFHGIIGMAVVIDISIKISILISFLNALTIISDRIGLNLDIPSEYKCGYESYDNNSDHDTIINSWYKIRHTTLIVGLFVAVCFLLIMQVLLVQINTIVSHEIDAISIVMIQLVIILAIQTLIGVVYYDSPMICNVCYVYLLSFFFFLF